MPRAKRILICPLNWGIGHATRCIPIINGLKTLGAEVIIGAEGRSLELLKREFQDTEFIEFPGVSVKYPARGSMAFKMFFSIPKILYEIYLEHRDLQQVIKNHNIDAVISDNRYGLWSKEVPSVFIIHQVMVKSPFLENMLYRITRWFMQRYHHCWIPDHEGAKNLSGDLSHQYPLPPNAKFIGPLSRFDSEKANIFTGNFMYDIVAIISGPEPQRTIFEKLIISKAKGSQYKVLMVLGRPELHEQKQLTPNISIVSHLPQQEMLEALLNAQVIISRSGYSTIMDLAALGKKAIFIPTPGQTEQEYLGRYFYDQGLHLCVNQKEFELENSMLNMRKFKGFIPKKNEVSKEILHDLIRNLHA